MIDRTFILILAFLMLIGSLVAFTADFISPRHATQGNDVVRQLPRVVITGELSTAQRPDAARLG